MNDEGFRPAVKLIGVRTMSELVTMPTYVRSVCPWQFRTGEYAFVVDVQMGRPDCRADPRMNRVCYRVRFADGVEDHWPVYDTPAQYVFVPGDLITIEQVGGRPQFVCKTKEG